MRKSNFGKKYLIFLAICRQIHKERMEKESVWMDNTKQENKEKVSVEKSRYE